VLAELPDTTQLRFDALRLLLPAAVASHHTAAVLMGLPVPSSATLHVSLPAPAAYAQIAGVRVHVTALGTDDVRRVGGRPVTSAARTFVDLAHVAHRCDDLTLIDLVTLGDAAVRNHRSDVDKIVARAVAATGRGCVRARQAARLVRAGVDSPTETHLRLLLVFAGLPEPEINKAVIDGAGPIAWPDLSYPAARMAIEYDGGHHRTSKRQWSMDKVRGRLVRDLGWTLLEVTARELYRHPDEILSWVRRHLAAAAYPGTPLRYGDAWRQHWVALVSTPHS
jgi:hypothetical protein